MGKSVFSLLPILFVLGAVFLFFLVLPTIEHMETRRAELMLRTQFAMQAAAQVAGCVVVLAALLILLRQLAAGTAVASPLTCGMCVLGGCYWSTSTGRSR